MQFPEVSGKNLLGQSFVLPGDFGSPVNIVLLAFYQEQQYQVDTWQPFLATLPDVTVYELPVVGNFPWYQRMMLDYWMRTGIPDRDVQARTITLYIDRKGFIEALGLPDTSTIYTLVVDRQGMVYGCVPAAYTEAKAQDLMRILVR